MIHEDLDFEGENWPTSLMHGTFTGTIDGNGHVFRNISLKQTNNSKLCSGLFGQLAETAVISDLVLENVTFTIAGGTRMAGATYGLLAGTVSEGATIEYVAVSSGKLLIDSGCYFGTDDYVIGLVCGMGTTTVDATNIICEATGDNPEKVTITVSENGVVEVEIVN